MQQQERGIKHASIGIVRLEGKHLQGDAGLPELHSALKNESPEVRRGAWICLASCTVDIDSRLCRTYLPFLPIHQKAKDNRIKAISVSGNRVYVVYGNELFEMPR
ncbi:MAG: hypothetical protein AB2L14_02670 [Candidatus Xenobiia bacterium LiM19]